MRDGNLKRVRCGLISSHHNRTSDGSDVVPDFSENAKYVKDVVAHYGKLLSEIESRCHCDGSFCSPTTPSFGAAAEQQRAMQSTVSQCIPNIADLNQRFRRLAKIGEGSFGEVFVVYDTVGKTYMTMKRVYRLLHRRGKSAVGLHNTTLRELQLLSTLSHPNIVSLLDYHILSDGTLLLFLPLISHDFASLLRSWSFNTKRTPPSVPLPVVKCFFRQILEGVAYMHSKKVVHRDLKPSNLMVDEKGIVKIIDFGWARYITADRTGKMTGPPCVMSYRPPEVLLGGSRSNMYGFAVDTWACGCILFELLTGCNFVKSRSERKVVDSLLEWLGSPPAASMLYYGDDAKRTITVKSNMRSQFFQRCEALSVRRPDAEFLIKFLQWEPKDRITASVAKGDSWFTSPPSACCPSDVALPPTNMFRMLERLKGLSPE